MSADGTALPPGAVVVVGGAGGTQARLADLHHAATVLDRAAERVAEAAERARTLASDLHDAAAWSPTTGAVAAAALAPVVGPRGAPGRAAELRRLAAGLRSAAAVYADTDAGVARLLHAGAGVALGGLGDLGPVGWLGGGLLALGAGVHLTAATLTLRLLRSVPGPLGAALRGLGADRFQGAPGVLGPASRALAGPGLLPPGLGVPRAATVEGLVPAVAGGLIGALPGRLPVRPGGVPAAAGYLGLGARAATHLLGTPRSGLVVVPAVTSTRPRDAPPAPVRGTADALARVQALYPTAGGVPGAVEIQRLDHADGRRTWVVAVPGTQDWSPVAGANPMDLTTNLDIVAGRPEDASELVVQAMTAAGVAPGEPVLIAGHSQGGMVALALAQDPAIQERFTMTAVVTAGSPVATTPGQLAPGAQALHLEHAHDAVPASDGIPNPAAPARTTVVVDQGLVAGTAPPSLVGAHDVGAYADTAAGLAAVDHPSLARFDAALAEVLGDCTAVATTQRYLGVRVPDVTG